MTPVAGGVADRDKDRQTELLCASKGIIIEGVPIDGIVGVLLQIWRANRVAKVTESGHGSMLRRDREALDIGR
jgi:hypothetical protein